MASITISKSDCKCLICGKAIVAGQKAEWIKKESVGHGEWSGKAYGITHWKLKCLSGCGQNLLSIEKKEQTIIAQTTINSMRDMGIVDSALQGMIAHYNGKGIFNIV